MENESGPGGCVGAECDWDAPANGNGIGIECFPGFRNCREATLLQAEPTSFHDVTLIEATAKINHILDEIPADSQGRKLAFLLSNLGILLAWVNHGPARPRRVTANDDDATVIKALRLKCVSADDA